MDHIEVCSTTLPFCRSPLEEGYSLEDMNAKGAFNYSSLQIVETSFLTEPVGWYPGREYFVVTRGGAVGVFHKLSEVHRSVDPFPSAVWHTYKTWNGAVNAWDVACRSGSVDILCKGRRTVTAPAMSQTLTPTRPNIRNPTPRLAPGHTSQTVAESAPLLSQLPSTTSDSESTSPKPIKKSIDRFELKEEEDGSSNLRKTYDTTDIHLDLKYGGEKVLHRSGLNSDCRNSPSPVASGSTCAPQSVLSQPVAAKSERGFTRATKWLFGA